MGEGIFAAYFPWWFLQAVKFRFLLQEHNGEFSTEWILQAPNLQALIFLLAVHSGKLQTDFLVSLSSVLYNLVWCVPWFL